VKKELTDTAEEKYYVVCSCGEKHLLKSGIDTPVYWCGDTLKSLRVEDEVEEEETEKRHIPFCS